MNTNGRTIEYQKDITIDGESYKVHTMQPEKAFLWMARLTKLIGEPITHMAKGNASEDGAVEALPRAVGALMSRLDEREVLEFAKVMISTVSQGAKFLDFNEHFQGRLGHLFKVFVAATEVQFSDFFAEIVATVQALFTVGVSDHMEKV